MIDRMGANETKSVTEANKLANSCVKGCGMFSVTGEVSGFRGPNARSGHCYFDIKDETSSLSVIVWRNTYRSLGFELKNGQTVVMHGGFDVYQSSGKLSFIASSVTMSGEGLLRQQVDALARKLEREGLMSAERKRPIPRFCERVVVITSLSGSVIEDVRRTLRRRNPMVALEAVGASVQGAEAPATMIAALEEAAALRPEAILLVRGGGSYEDLMAFNDEALARAVAACPVPVITGIGHEPDVTICDMVADRRCSTPTGAAESVAPALDELAARTEDRRVRLGRAFSVIAERAAQQTESCAALLQRSLAARIQRESTRIEGLARHRCLSEPTSFIEDLRTQLLLSEQRLADAIPHAVERQKRELERDASRLASAGERMLRPYEAEIGRYAASLDALSPLKVLGRGYAIAKDGSGHVVSDASQVAPGDVLDIALGSGAVRAEVLETMPCAADK